MFVWAYPWGGDWQQAEIVCIPCYDLVLKVCLILSGIVYSLANLFS